jgi:hypothetical protein
MQEPYRICKSERKRSIDYRRYKNTKYARDHLANKEPFWIITSIDTMTVVVKFHYVKQISLILDKGNIKGLFWNIRYSACS